MSRCTSRQTFVRILIKNQKVSSLIGIHDDGIHHGEMILRLLSTHQNFQFPK